MKARIRSLTVILTAILLLFVCPNVSAESDSSMPEMIELQIEFYDTNGVNDVYVVFPSHDASYDYSFPLTATEMLVTVTGDSDADQLEILVNKEAYGSDPYYDISDINMCDIEIKFYNDTETTASFNLHLERMVMPRISDIDAILWTIAGENDTFYPPDIVLQENSTILDVPYTTRKIILDFIITSCPFSDVTVFDENGSIVFSNQDSAEIEFFDENLKLMLASTIDGSTSYYELIFQRLPAAALDTDLSYFEVKFFDKGSSLLKTEVLDFDNNSEASIDIPVETDLVFFEASTKTFTSIADFYVDNVKLDNPTIQVDKEASVEIIITAENGASRSYYLNLNRPDSKGNLGINKYLPEPLVWIIGGLILITLFLSIHILFKKGGTLRS